MRRYSVSIVTEECSRQVPLADEKQAGDSRPYWSEASFQQIFLEHYASIVGLLHRLMGDRTERRNLPLKLFGGFIASAPSPNRMVTSADGFIAPPPAWASTVSAQLPGENTTSRKPGVLFFKPVLLLILSKRCYAPKNAAESAGFLPPSVPHKPKF